MLTHIYKKHIILKSSIFILFGLFLFAINVFAAVSITPASGGTNISSNYAVNSINPTYTTLGNTIITSQAKNDFAKNITNATLVLTAPAGWHFNPGIGSGSVFGTEIIFDNIVVTTSTVTFIYTRSNKNSSDAGINISGLQVISADSNILPNAGNILRTSVNPGTAIITGITDDVTNFGSLSQVYVPSPTYTLTYTAGINGSITGSSTQVVVSGTDGTAVTAVADAGYHFVNWSDLSMSNPRTDINVTSNLSVTANFEINPPIPISVTGVEINPKILSIRLGDTGLLTAVVSPLDATNKNVTWLSDNTNIATVSGGLITPISMGIANIIVETVDGNFTDTSIVTIISHTIIATHKRKLPSTITFSGLAFPNAEISVLPLINNQISIGNLYNALNDGTFNIIYDGELSQENNSFAFVAYDKNKNMTPIKIFNLGPDNRSIEYIFVAPTINLTQNSVSLGSFIKIFGIAVPNSKIEFMIDGSEVPETTFADSWGDYKLLINTYRFGLGKHTVKSRQINTRGIMSGYSVEKNFILTKTSISKTDLNGDGKLNIQDLGIFMSRYYSKDVNIQKTLDFNEDGKVDIKDLGSIFGSM